MLHRMLHARTHAWAHKRLAGGQSEFLAACRGLLEIRVDVMSDERLLQVFDLLDVHQGGDGAASKVVMAPSKLVMAWV